jgi:large subunit ribosomal protein L17
MMLANMATSLIKHKRINTTLQKARALRIYVEPLLTKSKDDTTNSRRVVFSYLQDKYAVTELFRDIAPKIASRPGGYTRILKIGNRLGDNADMVVIELVDFNEGMLKDSKAAAKKSTRRAGKKTSATETKEIKKVKEEVKEELVEVEDVKEEVAEAEEVKEEVAEAEEAIEEAVEAEEVKVEE